MSGHFWYSNFWVPDSPPPPSNFSLPLTHAHLLSQCIPPHIPLSSAPVVTGAQVTRHRPKVWQPRHPQAMLGALVLTKCPIMSFWLGTPSPSLFESHIRAGGRGGGGELRPVCVGPPHVQANFFVPDGQPTLMARPWRGWGHISRHPSSGAPKGQQMKARGPSHTMGSPWQIDNRHETGETSACVGACEKTGTSVMPATVSKGPYAAPPCRPLERPCSRYGQWVARNGKQRLKRMHSAHVALLTASGIL